VEIDKDVESVVREAFAAAVAQEPDRFAAAVVDLANRGDDFTRDAVGLAVAVDTMALLVLHDGEAPDDDELTELTREFVASRSWSGIGEDEAHRFLTALAGFDRELLHDLSPGDIGHLGLVLGSWLLSAFLPEDKDWTDLLDALLDILESAPAEG
jgi:hypothetical protein